MITQAARYVVAMTSGLATEQGAKPRGGQEDSILLGVSDVAPASANAAADAASATARVALKVGGVVR